LTGASALLACYEGQSHDIVLQCIASYLAVKGWKVYNLGQNTPTKSLVGAIKRYKPTIVVLAALLVENERKFVRDVNQTILRPAHRVGAKLVIGGAKMKTKFGGRLKADVVSESMRDVEGVIISHRKHL